MYSPMSRVPAVAGDPWWLPCESVLLAHLTQPFQLRLYQLPVYWALTECGVHPLYYWKGFVIWKIVGNKAQKAHAPTYVSYRFPLRGASGAERPRVISWMQPLCRDCAVCWCCSPDAVRNWPYSGFLFTLAHSCYQMWNLRGLSLARSYSLSLCWADLCCRGGTVCSNLHCIMGTSMASSLSSPGSKLTGLVRNPWSRRKVLMLNI